MTQEATSPSARSQVLHLYDQCIAVNHLLVTKVED